jgi:acyl-coenzyme A thioesterase PaaI-like protein
MTPRWFRHLFNIYPPYLGAGVRVREISPDWRYVRVEMPLRWYNRNYVGTHFGGSLFAMADPFLMIMILRNIGPGFLVWDKAGEIEFVSPGRGTVTAEFRVTDEMLQDIRDHTANGEKYLPWYATRILGQDGKIVARIRKQLYIRASLPERASVAENSARA